MRVAVSVCFLSEECSFFSEDLHDAGIPLKDVGPNKFRQATFVSKKSVVIDRAENLESVLLADGVIISTVTGSNVNRTCS